MQLDNIDKSIINHMQDGFPVCEEPFAEISRALDIEEDTLLGRLQALLDNGILSRFGPLYNVEKLGGKYSLIAMRLTQDDLEHAIAVINSYPEVAHNYERDHEFNIWFIIATESNERLLEVLEDIENRTGHKTFNMPKLEEFHVNLRFVA